jgi:regulator of nonsense transcripts 2
LTEEEKQRREAERKAAEDVAAAEAERQRLEKERIALEQSRDAQRAKRRELCDSVEQAIESLTTVATTVQEHAQHRAELSPENLTQFRKDFETKKKTLKADLKKCTTFVKKVKSGTAWSMKPIDIEREVASLNLSRYVEEVTAALLECKLKLPDLPTVVALCISMHRRYEDFCPNLLPNLWTAVTKSEDAKLRRLYVRLLTELLLHGVVTEPKPLLKLLAQITGAANSYAVTDANMVVSFVKAAGFEILGITYKGTQSNMQLLETERNRMQQFLADGKSLDVPQDSAPEEIPQVITNELSNKGKETLDKIQQVLSERAAPGTIAEAFCTHCSGALETLSKSWVEAHATLQRLEKRCQQDRLLQGNLSEAREKGLADARRLDEQLQKAVEALCDALDRPMPVLQEEEVEQDVNTGGPGVELWTKGEDDANNDFGPFDDEETKNFYFDLPDLLTTVPPALSGISPEEIEKLKAENARKYGDGSEASVAEDDLTAADVEPISEAQLEAAEEQEKEAVESEQQDEENKDTPHYKLQVLLEQELPECNRRETVDELAEKFVVNHGSSKNSRKRFAKALFQVPQTRLDLLPYYARFAAIMDRIYPDISSQLATELEQQFHGQAKFKKQQNPEGRLKTARYLGELTKFRVAPPIVSLRCIQRCLEDFSGFNIDVACCLLESCGRFLYRTEHTVGRLTSLMDTMMRISKAKNLDERYQALISSAFFMVKPPAAAPRKQAKVYPPLEAYLRYLLLVRLVPEEASVSFVTKQLLKLPWSDQSKQCGELICRYMLKACRKGRYKAVPAVASVAASIRRNKPEVAARLVDACLEEIQLSMEHPNLRDQQRTITYARLLGELHAASLITSPLVVQQLYNFINFGHEIPEALRQASSKHTSEATEQKDNALPIYNSASGINRAIQEDEEMEDAELETKQDAEAPRIVAVSSHSEFDPRVPSLIDPPNSVFRIKLVCTLLEASSKSIVIRHNLDSLEGFITAFQRYLFTKTTLPTEVEFALLDTFDALDSQWKRILSRDRKPDTVDSKQGFPRFDSWTDAHNATVAREESDALLEKRARIRLEALAGVTEGDVDSILNDVDLVMEEVDDDDESDGSDGDETYSGDEDMEEEEEEMVADEEERADEVENGGDDQEGDEEDLEEDSDEDEDDEEYDVEEEFDEDAYMRQLEEEAFERELRRLTLDALEKGKNTARATTYGKVADYMPSGSQFIRKKQSEAPNGGPAVTLGGQEGVSFQLLKKGNKGKIETKQLVVPKDTNLAIRVSKQEGVVDSEHDIIKARVLQYEAESAEQEMSGGNVYLEQAKLQVIRNRLTIEDINRNFGLDERPSSEKRNMQPSAQGNQPTVARGTGRGRGRSGRGGRTIKHY